MTAIKKALNLLFIACILLCSCRHKPSHLDFATFVFYQDENSFVDKIYRFDQITIVLTEEASSKKETYTIDDFPGLGFLSIEERYDISAYCGFSRRAFVATLSCCESGFCSPINPREAMQKLRKNKKVYSIKANLLEPFSFNKVKNDWEPSFIDIAYATAMERYYNSKWRYIPETNSVDFEGENWNYLPNKLRIVLKQEAPNNEYSAEDFPELEIKSINSNLEFNYYYNILADGRQMLEIVTDFSDYIGIIESIKKLMNNELVLYASLCND